MKRHNYHKVLWIGLVYVAWAPVPQQSVAVSQSQSGQQASCSEARGVKVPKFRVARKFRGDVRPGLFLYISLSPSDFSPDKLIALACKLGEDHAAEESLFVWIFDSYRAAKRFDLVRGGPDRATNFAYRGGYSFSRRQGAAYGQSLDWRPDPNDLHRSERIDLGSPPAPPPQVQR